MPFAQFNFSFLIVTTQFSRKKKILHQKLILHQLMSKAGDTSLFVFSNSSCRKHVKQQYLFLATWNHCSYPWIDILRRKITTNMANKIWKIAIVKNKEIDVTSR